MLFFCENVVNFIEHLLDNDQGRLDGWGVLWVYTRSQTRVHARTFDRDFYGRNRPSMISNAPPRSRDGDRGNEEVVRKRFVV